MNKILLALSLCLISLPLLAETPHEAITANYFETIKHHPKKLSSFLQNMPKGGDLHVHNTGSSMAENLIDYAKNDALCVDRRHFSLSVDPLCSAENTLNSMAHHPDLYNAIIDAWSMRHFHPGQVTAHDHFFAAFGKYSLIAKKYTGEILTEIVQRAGEQNELYLEIMLSPDNNAAAMLGKKVGWDNDFAKMHEKLLDQGLKNIVNDVSEKLSVDESKMNHLLRCGTEEAKRGCQVTVRYLYQTKRELPPEQVFAQLLLGFESAMKDARVVGINMVQPEDGALSMRDYDLHMQMVGFLHQRYPNVNISLHAGELTPDLVPPAGLASHIRNAVTLAKASRIGHGVDIRYENNYHQLLDEMAKQHVMVEINLSSNEAILGVAGKNHPLPLYLEHRVPVALSTDDEGVLRTNLTEQYQKAILTYQFSYQTVKMLARNSITYSFLPGQRLWNDDQYHQMNAACAKDNVADINLSITCQHYLNANEKAQMQWKLEKQFNEFEKGWMA